MKKALAIFAIATFVACGNPASTEAPVADSTAVVADSTATPVVDSTAATKEK